MLISQEVLKIIIDDWITPEKSLAKACKGKFEEVPCYADAFMGTGFGYVFSTYNATARETQEKSLWVRRALGEEKWIIFAQTYTLDIKPMIEIWDNHINIRLDDDNLNGWEYLRIEALYDKLKPYVLCDIPESGIEERNYQALVLGNCITDWLSKNRPIFKHPLEMASSLKNWDITYATDYAHISWADIPNFIINMMDDDLKYHHLYGRYILHDMPEKDNKPYWVISDKPIPEYPITYFNQEKRDQMFIYIFRQHVEYILPENEQWFTGYTKSLVESIREAINGSTIPDWCREIQMMYQQKALQYKRAEETLATKRGALVRTHKESEAIYPDPVKKEENVMRIDLKNVAVKIQRQHPHDCIITIGRLNDNEKNQLLNMFPLSIDALQRRPPMTIMCDQKVVGGQKLVGRYGNKSVIAQIVPTELMPKTDDCRPMVPTVSPMFQMTITVHLPNIPDFKIYDSDACNILIIDRMIISQTESSDTCLFEPNWFDSVYSNPDNGIKKVRLSYVAVKVGNKLGDYNYIQIGRIGLCEKELLEKILPSKIQNFKAKRTPNNFIDFYELKLCVQLTDIEDSNNCTIEVLYDEKKPDVICVSNQNLFDEHFFSPWFDSNSQSFPQIFHIPDEIVKKAIQNIDQIKKGEYIMFSKADIDALKRITEELEELRDHIPDGCDTPNATGGFKPSEVNKLPKYMRDNCRILVPTVKEILINKPATIIFWSDGSKTTSVCDDADKFDPEVGISICIAKKYLGGTENLQLEARRALTRYERREAKKLKKNKKTNNNKSNQSSKKKK